MLSIDHIKFNIFIVILLVAIISTTRGLGLEPRSPASEASILNQFELPPYVYIVIAYI